MAKPLVSDDLWAVVAPLLPPRPPRPKGGRPPHDVNGRFGKLDGRFDKLDLNFYFLLNKIEILYNVTGFSFPFSAVFDHGARFHGLFLCPFLVKVKLSFALCSFL